VRLLHRNREIHWTPWCVTVDLCSLLEDFWIRRLLHAGVLVRESIIQCVRQKLLIYWTNLRDTRGWNVDRRLSAALREGQRNVAQSSTRMPRICKYCFLVPYWQLLIRDHDHMTFSITDWSGANFCDNISCRMVNI
jgi:hypothetical protein